MVDEENLNNFNRVFREKLEAAFQDDPEKTNAIIASLAGLSSGMLTSKPGEQSYWNLSHIVHGRARHHTCCRRQLPRRNTATPNAVWTARPSTRKASG